MRKSVLLLSYYSSYGPQDNLYEYFSSNSAFNVFRIDIPLPELPFLKSIRFMQKKKVYRYPTVLKPILISYLLHPVQVLFLLLLRNKKYNIIIAQSALLAHVGILLRFLNKCDTVIYYSHGFDPKRFPNKLSGNFYKFLDLYAAKLSDYNWVLGKKMLAERKTMTIPLDKLFWVPIALPTGKIKKVKTPSNNALLFIGMLTVMNGVLILPKIIEHLKKKIPTVKLDVLGDGPLMEKLKHEVERLHLQKNIIIHGLVQFDDFALHMSNHTVGIAPYATSDSGMLHMSDSMKLRLYWAASLPVITTKGYPFSQEVEENELGFCASFNAKDFSKKIFYILNNKKIQQQIRLRAKKYSMEFDQKKILDKILKKIDN